MRTLRPVLFAIVALGLLGAPLAAQARARPTTPAQGSPVRQSQVWVNTSTRVYHCPGTRWYGATTQGTYLSEPEAQAGGYRPARGRGCGASQPAVAAPRSTPPEAASAGAVGAGQVWVNSRSRVYHCPGTRWYGTTSAGFYMSEQQAQARGYRAARGQTCS